MLWEILKQLPKNRLARVHGHPPELSGEYHPESHANSNRKKHNWIKEHKQLNSYSGTTEFNRTVVGVCSREPKKTLPAHGKVPF
jgi:hypothetical protein